MRPGLRHFLTILLIPACIVTVAYVVGIRINLTPSMPLGIYYLSNNTPKRGDIVAACLPDNISKEGLMRHYLLYGHCQGHSMPVLKKIIAVPGDKVIVTDTEMIVKERIFIAPQQTTDLNRLPVTHFIDKNFYGHAIGFWLYGENNSVRSWDSRYYGGIPCKNMLGVYKPLWTMKKSGDWHGDLALPGASPHQSPPNKIKSPVNSRPRVRFVSYFSWG